MTDNFTCGRRAESGMDDEASPFKLSGKLLDHWRPDGTCSHCGSLSPEKFFEAIEAGEEVIPTDKGYKAYVAPGHRKFYFQHLDADGRQRFIDLYNSKAMKIGYPGRFYVRPFFCAERAGG